MLNRATAEAGLTIRIADRGPVGQVTLRGNLDSPKLQAAVTAATGGGVPQPLMADFDEGTGAVWMSPDELLLFTGYDEADNLVAQLEKALAGEHHMAVNVSDARAVITLSGTGVAEVLAKGAPLDFSEAAFPTGRARRTHLGSVAAGIWRLGREEWEVVCFRSYARHLFDWLAMAARKGSEVG
jgi:sarcosine oxidase subunit gamma